jgi:hypothetical protein
MRYLVIPYIFSLLFLCLITAGLISIQLDDTGHATPLLLNVAISSWIILPLTCVILRKVYKHQRQKFKVLSLCLLSLTALIQLYYITFLADGYSIDPAIIYPAIVLTLTVGFIVNIYGKESATQ